jgi:glycosyltransferase involved in cell wall biosynthesis
MNLILLTHPDSLNSTSMPRFARMIGEGMEARGHRVSYWTSPACFGRCPLAPQALRKWLGYIDQFLIFPWILRRRLKALPPDSLIVVVDQALGIWVPHLAHLPHVVHVHDFTALRSALDEFPENLTSRTGKIYQHLIRKGFSQARNFISVSEKTRTDLHGFHSGSPNLSEVVYNGVNPRFQPGDPLAARRGLARVLELPLVGGYLLHVGGNQWYKNRAGVIHLYEAWRRQHDRPIPLLLMGDPPSIPLRAACEASAFRDEIHFISSASDEVIQQAYAGASVFLFPSIAEGFGWPIAEAMASGCPVVTTNEAPMTEVAGNHCFLIPRMPRSGFQDWAATCAAIVEQAWLLQGDQREEWCREAVAHTRKFDQDQAIHRIEIIYRDILKDNQL